MRVELGLFEEDSLLFRGTISISENELEEENEIIKLKHELERFVMHLICI